MSLDFVCALLSVDHKTRKAIIDFSKDDFIRYESIRNQPAIVMTDFREMAQQNRLLMPSVSMFNDQIDWLTKEAMESMWNPEKGKVFKMEVPGASDDLIQSIAGAAFNCQINSEDLILPSLDKKDDFDTDDFFNELGRGTKDKHTPDQQNEMGFIEDNFDPYAESRRMGGIY